MQQKTVFQSENQKKNFRGGLPYTVAGDRASSYYTPRRLDTL